MAADKRPDRILIAGPTASGKSALALTLAEKLGAAVVNADSMQVYRDLRILTSRPAPEDEARVPHLLYGHVDAAEAYSAGRFAADARRVLADYAGQPLIFVGGTGLYFDALIRGLSTTPAIPDDVRAHWRSRQDSPELLHAELARRDPEMAKRLRATDPQRLVRALEVIDATGVSLAKWQQGEGAPLVDPASATKIVLTLDRAELRARIAARFNSMMKNGALEEIRTLIRRDLAPVLPAMKAIGVPPLITLIRGGLSEQGAADLAITQTRQYAKRQETWFRNKLSDWSHVPAEAALRQF